MTLTRFPIADFVSLRDAMDRLFEDSFVRPSNGCSGLAAGHIAVPVDLWETPDAFHLRADLPGLKPDDIDISVTGDTVQISGEVKSAQEEKTEGWLRQERRTGKFVRGFSLGTQIDPNKVEASFEDGVLSLVLQKSEAVRPRQIKVTPSKTIPATTK